MVVFLHDGFVGPWGKVFVPVQIMKAEGMKRLIFIQRMAYFLHRFYELMVDDQDDKWCMLKGADLKRYFSIVYESLLVFHGFIINGMGVKVVLYAFYMGVFWMIKRLGNHCKTDDWIGENKYK